MYIIMQGVINQLEVQSKKQTNYYIFSACKSETIPIAVENEPTEERLAKLRKELGIESSEHSFFDNPLFYGDF